MEYHTKWRFHLGSKGFKHGIMFQLSYLLRLHNLVVIIYFKLSTQYPFTGFEIASWTKYIKKNPFQEIVFHHFYGAYFRRLWESHISILHCVTTIFKNCKKNNWNYFFKALLPWLVILQFLEHKYNFHHLHLF